MPLELVGEEKDLVESLGTQLDRFGRERLNARKTDAAKRIDREIVEEMADMGLFGLTIPQEYGGAGLSLLAACALVQGFARWDRSVATTLGLHLGLGTRGLVAFGSDELKAEILPGLAAGRPIAAFAATEAGAGSDLTAVSTKAVQDGDSLRVDGEKIYVTNGGWAGVYTILASTPGLGGARLGQSLIVLKRDDPGVQVGAEEDKLGLRGSSTTTVVFDGARIPLSRVIGVAGQGKPQIEHVLAWGRTAMAAGCVGTAVAARDAAIEHVLVRKQFRKPLAQIEVVRRQVADMCALHHAMESLVRYVADAEQDRMELAFRSLAGKVICSDGAWEICDLAIQLHGGSGFIEETGLPLLLRDGRITRIFEGANDVLLGHAGTFEATAPRVRTPLPEDGPTADLARRANEMAAGVADRAQTLKSSFGIGIIRQPALLHQLGKLVVLREACDATVLRARLDPTEERRALAAHWLHMAGIRMAPHFGELASQAPVEAITEACYARATP